MDVEQELPDLRRTTAHLLGAQIARNLAPILLLFLLARFTDQGVVGQFSLTLAIATPFFVFAQLGLRTVSLTLNPDAGFSEYAKTQLGAVVLALLVVTLVAAIGLPDLLGVMLFVGLLKTADAFSDFLSGSLQRRHRSRTVLIGSLIYAVAASVAAAAMLGVTRRLEPTILVVAMISLLAMYMCFYRPARSLIASSPIGLVSQRGVPRILAAGVPLGLTTAILSLISTFPQYVITATDGVAETARFAVLLYVYALADLVTGTLAQAWIPTAQRELLNGTGTRTLWLALRSALRWTLFYVPLVFIGLLLVGIFFPGVFGPNYTLTIGEAIPLGLAILALPVAHFTVAAVAIENHYMPSLVLAGTSAVVAVVGCLVLIPMIGVTGAFVALFASVVARALTAVGILVWFLRTGSRRLPR